MALAEQIAAFSTAEIVFGIMGAAMCNSIFSPQATKIAYLAPEYMHSTFFLDMDAALGRERLNILYCPAIPDEQTPLLRRNILVDLQELDGFYRSVLS